MVDPRGVWRSRSIPRSTQTNASSGLSAHEREARLVADERPGAERQLDPALQRVSPVARMSFHPAHSRWAWSAVKVHHPDSRSRSTNSARLGGATDCGPICTTHHYALFSANERAATSGGAHRSLRLRKVRLAQGPAQLPKHLLEGRQRDHLVGESGGPEGL